ncbi:thermitase [Portibacter lacus]|uniref:Thermitase n=1 Tax=Portibacter lacus TaxID=1099794 RepID=A0AA37WBR1_9BACT|nr:thermitase [Portibacter lacus]
MRHVDFKKNSFNIPSLDKLNKQHGVEKIHVINPENGADTYSIDFSSQINISKTIYQYYDTRLFSYVEPDYVGHGGGEIIPNDAEFSKQWGLHNDGSFPLGNGTKEGADIEMKKAWEISKGNEKTIIAILDSGLKLDHPEISNRLWSNEKGFHGKDFANNDDIPADDLGHGTNVTSIIAANANNNNGFAGVNWNSKIMVLKILNENNQGYYSWWAEAIYYAANNGANVLNMSVGGSSYSAVMEDAINYATNKGVIIVACMMNENSSVPYYPAAYDNTIAVGSTDPDDKRSNSFPWNTTKGSSYGDHIDVSAPGNYIYGISYNSNSNYGTYWSGTSQATPHVVGVVSLLLDVDPDLTLESIRSILTNSAEDQVGRSNEDLAGWDPYHGHGRINAYSALGSLATNTVEINKASTFRLSPNPIKKGDQLLVNFQNEDEKVISIFDTAGRLVFMNKTKNQSFSLNSGNLEVGVYVIKVQEKGKALSARKFVIER